MFTHPGVVRLYFFRSPALSISLLYQDIFSARASDYINVPDKLTTHCFIAGVPDYINVSDKLTTHRFIIDLSYSCYGSDIYELVIH